MKFIKKLAAAGFVYFAIATLFAQMIVVVYLWYTWGVDWKRSQDAVAVIRGNAIIEPVVKLEKVPEKVPEAQPSFEEILKARAIKTRDFELRDEALSQGKAILRQQQDTLAKETEIFNLARIGLERQVADYESKTKAEGMDQNVAMIQSMEPELAKVQLMKMYEDNEMDALISIVKSMELRKCAAILNILDTKDDEERLAEILRRIRDGFDFKPPIDTTTSNIPPQI